MKNKILIYFISLFLFLLLPARHTFAVSCGDDVPSGESDLKIYVDDCNSKLTTLSGQKATLSQALGILSTQINLTQAKIATQTKLLDQLEIEITDLSGKIQSLDYSLTDLTKLFVARVRSSYVNASRLPLIIIAESTGVTHFAKRLQYLESVRDHDHLVLINLEKSRLDYDTQKSLKEEKQKEIETAKIILDREKSALATQVSAKNKLLSDTKNDEAKYQSLLSQAQAQLSSLAQFADSIGTSLISHKELSDSWGKYYNQRDESWGGLLVNGDTSNCRGGPCSLARIGCLVTSYAMVVSHYGGSLSPSDVARTSNNFYLNTADFNNPGPSANGHQANRVDNPSVEQLREALNSGKSVIVGMSMNGGYYPKNYSDHWVVLRSLDGDSFRINDPAYPDGMNVSLQDHYASWKIIQARVYD